MKNLILILLALFFTLETFPQTIYKREKNFNLGSGTGDRSFNFDRNPDADTVTLTQNSTLNRLEINKPTDITGALTVSSTMGLADWLTIGSGVDEDERVVFDVGLGAGNPYLGYDSTDGALGFFDLNAGIFKRFGSGEGGTLDTFHTQRFEENIRAAQLVCGNNATFDNGGAYVGSNADDEATQIKGLRSIRSTQAAGSLNDWCKSPNISLESKEQNQKIGISFYSRYSGLDNEINFIIKDITNNKVLIEIPVKASSTPLKHEAFFDSTETTANIVWGFQVKTENISAQFDYDEIALELNPLSPTNIYASTETYDCSAIVVGFGAITNEFSKCWREGEFLNVVGSFQAGNPASTGTLAGIQLPDGLIIDNNAVISGNVHRVGTFQRGQNGGNHYDGVTSSKLFVDGSTNQVFISQSSGASVFVKALDGNILADNDLASYELKVPVQGWGNTNRGVVVRGNITSDVSNSNTYKAVIQNNGTATVVSESHAGFFTVTRNSQGVVQVDLPSGVFVNSLPHITATVSAQAGTTFTGTRSAEYYDVTNNQFFIATKFSDASSNNVIDYDFTIEVSKQGLDFVKESEKTIVLPEGIAPKTCYIKEVQLSGVASTTGLSSATYNTLNLNNISGQCSFASVSGNQVSLQKGSYKVRYSVPYTRNSNALQEGVTRFRNTSDNQSPFTGYGFYLRGSGTTTGSINAVPLTGFGSFEIDSLKTFEVQLYLANSTAGDSIGRALGQDTETYTQVEIIKTK